jgi:outer membrane murein-binding lipoprotein Lpp
MAFTVADFRDLLTLLDEHPEWRAELRRQLLTDELLELPSLVREQAEHLVAIDARLDTLATRLDTLAARMDELTAQVQALASRMDELTAQVRALASRMDDLTGRIDTLTARLGDVIGRLGSAEGEVLELRYARRAPAYFSRLARRLRVIEPSDLADLLDDAVDDGRLTEAERQKVLLADLVVSGRRREDQADIYLLVEVSAGIGHADVERAAEHAAILLKLGRSVQPVVGGYWINPHAEAQAKALGVLPVLTNRKPAPENV